ncbi:MAG TPA: alkaline phosphatase family protein [Gammaproteobacteria bacterium]|nr:alkaline phosphatase family protein [Gammaproteobacteria bacterium]
MKTALWILSALAALLPIAASAGHAGLPHYAHVVVVIEENKAFGEISGNADAPYINALASRGVLLTGYHAVAHPSLPNYLALFAGSTGNVMDDACHYSFSSATLYGALHAAGAGFITYAEGLPRDGYTDCGAGEYRKKHNPAAYWQPRYVPAEVTRPFSAFPVDFARLPRVAFVIPDLLNDMHDGTIRMGDQWLQQNLARYADWAEKHDSLLIVTWDEDNGSEDNRIMTLLFGAHLKPGQYPQHYDHYSLLRTLTDLFHAKPVGHAKTAAAIDGIWKS